MRMVMSRLGLLRQFGQKLGPYLMLEILLPGGTLLALLLFLYQRRKIGVGDVASRWPQPTVSQTERARCPEGRAGEGQVRRVQCAVTQRHVWQIGGEP